ncbi:hypothetical protein PC114_g8930 [Phytophthora cactorum]|nr:hypothetical protein PC114_g8930 [Phytophthora cactorum]
MTPRLCFEAAHGGVWLNGRPFFLKGASFFGMESDICVPHGLWGGPDSTTLAAVAQLLRSNGFNLVRIPLAVAAVANNIEVDRYKMGNETALLKAFEGRELHYLDVLDYVVHELERHDLLVLLDAHVMQPAGAITPLWYDEGQGCPETVVEQMWTTLASRYANQWNVLGADLNNEPHGEATWGSGDVKTDWRLAAVRLAEKVLTLCSHWLIFVEGVQTTSCDAGHDMPCFWGEDLQAQQSEVPLVIGEWGGRHENPKDWSWQTRFAEYAQQIGVSGVIFWCVNPNGGDTDGLLCADWRTPNTNALQLLSRFAGTPVPPSC